MQIDGESWMENEIEFILELSSIQSTVMTYTDIDIEEPIVVILILIVIIMVYMNQQLNLCLCWIF